MQLPEGKDLYDILDLTKDQVENDNSIVKKAYRKLALKYHPDKQSSTSPQLAKQATQQFLLVGYAYSILSDSDKRNHYDLTGGSEDFDAFFSGGKDWTNHFKNQWYGVVSNETIEAHALKYKGSAEEREDVLHYYTHYKGNMNHILAQVEHSKAADVARFMELIETAIEKNLVDSFPAYAKTTSKAAQMRRLKREEDEAKKAEQANTAKANKRKQQQYTSCNDSDEIESSAAEEAAEIDSSDDDNEDVTLDSFEDVIDARQRQRQRSSNFDEILANLQATNNKSKGKGRTSASVNIDDTSLLSTITDPKPTSVPTSKESGDKVQGKFTSRKNHQTTTTTRVKSKKQTKQKQTKTTTEDAGADASITTTSVTTKSKKFTKLDRKKRQRTGDQKDTDNHDKESTTNNSMTMKNKKPNQSGPSNDGKAALLEKSHRHPRPHQRKSTTKAKSSTR